MPPPSANSAFQSTSAPAAEISATLGRANGAGKTGQRAEIIEGTLNTAVINGAVASGIQARINGNITNL